VQEAVSGVLRDRAREADGINRMLVLSIGAHMIVLAGIWLMPAAWRSRNVNEAPVMTISLGGVEGPDTGGLTPLAGRAVQEIAKPNAPKVAETPPAAKPPEMVEPDRVAKAAPPRTVAKPADASKARKPTTGAEIKAGSAPVNTGGAAIPFGGGLATSAGGAGDGVKLDVQNFCCPQYIVLMRQRIQANWNSNQGATGQPEIKFTIRRDGMLTNVELEKSSGQALLDLEARRAVLKTMQLPPLPREYTGDHLTVHLTFDFKR
jgi:TonB family protein